MSVPPTEFVETPIASPHAQKLVLASGSPRRRALLEAAGIDVDVVAQAVDESWPTQLAPQKAVLEVAKRKWQHIAKPAPVILVADTIVVLEGVVLGKPETPAQACAMLRQLSGRTHQVMTGFALRADMANGGLGLTYQACVTTDVVFRHLQPEEVTRYVATGDSLDKAGGYGIQSLGGHLVDRIQGSYTNVVGLPLTEVLEALQQIQRLLPHG